MLQQQHLASSPCTLVSRSSIRGVRGRGSDLSVLSSHTSNFPSAFIYSTSDPKLKLKIVTAFLNFHHLNFWPLGLSWSCPCFLSFLSPHVQKFVHRCIQTQFYDLLMLILQWSKSVNFFAGKIWPKTFLCICTHSSLSLPFFYPLQSIPCSQVSSDLSSYVAPSHTLDSPIVIYLIIVILSRGSLSIYTPLPFLLSSPSPYLIHP